MDVRDNRAENGGAIFSSGGGILTLAQNVLIENNLADRDGGGLLIAGGASVLYAIGAGLSITNNEAYARGGGVYVDNASAFIASPGLAGRAVLQSNKAAVTFDGGEGHGGAIDINTGRVVVFSIDASSPTRIANNRAREKGGAFYVNDAFEGSPPTALCLLDVHLQGNSANGGAAIYSEVAADADTTLVYNVPARSECSVPPSAPLQPVRCLRNRGGCNVIEGHVTQTIAGVRSGGGVVTLRKNADLLLRDATIRNNVAGFLVSAEEAYRVTLDSALIVENDLSGYPIRLGFAAVNNGFQMRSVTIAENTIPSGNSSVILDAVQGAPARIDFNNNLIFQPPRVALIAAFPITNSSTRNWNFNATNAPQVLPNQLLLDAPRFENAEFGDFRLRIASLAVNAFDAASVLGANAQDLDGRPRPITLGIFSPDPSNVDVGAFERQEGDPLIVNGTFSAATQLRYWEPSANGEAIPGVFWDAQDAAGNANSGSALVNLPASLSPRLTVLRRCFNVPVPGRYTIAAKALRGNPPNADDALLVWRYRETDPLANCDLGAVQGTGEIAFSRGSGFQSLAAPLDIVLPSITPTSTIEIRLDAVSGLNLNGLTNVRFDDVAIIGEPLLPDGIFANSFE
jgi:hypothetical protein